MNYAICHQAREREKGVLRVRYVKETMNYERLRLSNLRTISVLWLLSCCTPNRYRWIEMSCGMKLASVLQITLRMHLQRKQGHGRRKQRFQGYSRKMLYLREPPPRLLPLPRPRPPPPFESSSPSPSLSSIMYVLSGLGTCPEAPLLQS